MSLGVRPPRLPGLPGLGNVVDWIREPFAASQRWAAAGHDAATLRFPGSKAVMLFTPALVGELLIKGSEDYRKGPLARGLGCLIGDSIITMSGPIARRHRRLLAPAFNSQQLQRYAELVSRHARVYAARWRAAGEVDIYQELLDYAFDILVDALGGSVEIDRRERLRRQFQRVLLDFTSWEFLVLNALTDGAPYSRLSTRRSRRIRALRLAFDRLIHDLLADARARARAHPHPEDEGLLAALLPMLESDDALTVDELCDDLSAVFIAGQETTAMTLAMTLDLLGRHPEIRAEVHRESARVLGDRVPGFADLRSLPTTDAVVHEALRLYPAVFGVGRQALRATSLGPYTIDPGDLVIAPAWVIQRDPRWWGADAAEFRPQRWIDAKPPRFAWFPFGGGPHQCIGMQLSLVEMVLSLAYWTPRLRFTGPAEPPPLATHITVRPRGGLPVAVTPTPTSPAGPLGESPGL